MCPGQRAASTRALPGQRPADETEEQEFERRNREAIEEAQLQDAGSFPATPPAAASHNQARGQGGGRGESARGRGQAAGASAAARGRGQASGASAAARGRGQAAGASTAARGRGQAAGASTAARGATNSAGPMPSTSTGRAGLPPILGLRSGRRRRLDM